MCAWCKDPNSTNESGEELCRTHTAEFEGISVDELDRSESEWKKDQQ